MGNAFALAPVGTGSNSSNQLALADPTQITASQQSHHYNLSNDLSQQNLRIDLSRTETYLNEDQTYTQTITQKIRLLTPAAILSNQSLSSPEYYPGYQKVTLVKAYVVEPDGTQVNVPASNVFTTTVPADPDAPGFDTGLIQSVAFPQLRVGCELVIEWQYQQLVKPAYNYADVSTPSFGLNSLYTEMSVNMPEDMYVRWASRGPYQMKEVRENGRHIISAVLGPQMAQDQEPFMPATTDSSAFFEVSTIKTWQEIADKTWQQVQPSQVVTPAIQKMVNGLVGNKTGKEAAQILYNWVANNIYYMAVTLNPKMGYVPTPATKAIFDRYTDCKGHANLLQTLLKAVSIDSYPVLVNWDNSLTQYPLPINAFDHEMLYIPSLNIFANPTNNYNPFGAPLEETNYDSSSLQVLAGKPVLIAQPNGPGLVQLPNAIAAENQYHLIENMELDLQGDIQAVGTIAATGNADSTIRGFLSQGSTISNTINETLYNNGINGQGSGTGTAATDLSKLMDINYIWQAPGYAQLDDEDLTFTMPAGPDFYPASFFSQFLNQSGQRQFPIIVGSGIFDWNYSLQLPEAYEMKKLPRNINLENDAGSYIATYSLNGVNLAVHRTLTLNKNVYQTQDYINVYSLISAAMQDSNTIFHAIPIPVSFPGIPAGNNSSSNH